MITASWPRGRKRSFARTANINKNRAARERRLRLSCRTILPLHFFKHLLNLAVVLPETFSVAIPFVSSLSVTSPVIRAFFPDDRVRAGP